MFKPNFHKLNCHGLKPPPPQNKTFNTTFRVFKCIVLK